jgi:hypothetical protein
VQRAVDRGPVGQRDARGGEVVDVGRAADLVDEEREVGPSVERVDHRLHERARRVEPPQQRRPHEHRARTRAGHRQLGRRLRRAVGVDRIGPILFGVRRGASGEHAVARHMDDPRPDRRRGFSDVT